MNAGLNDSNTFRCRRTDRAFTLGRLALLIAVFANSVLSTVLLTAIHPTACFAVEFVEIEFKADSRSPAKALGQDATEMELSDEPIRLQPTAWYADKTKKKTKEKSESSKWAPKPLAALGTNIALPGGAIPKSDNAVANMDDTYCGYSCNRGWSGLCYCFAATGLYYNPLYFEEVNLERYGYGCQPCLQSAASAAHFFGHVPLLPYMMATDCPSDCIYALGHYRPGSCVPWRRHCLPMNKRGGLGQAGAIVGLVFLLP